MIKQRYAYLRLSSFTPWARSTFALFRPTDSLTFLYLAGMAVLLTFFHHGVAQWPLFVLAHVAVMVVIALVIQWAHRSQSKILHFIRDVYPLILFTFMFVEISKVINIFFPFWLEQHLIQWDLWLFGTHPTVWVESFYYPWLIEFMAFSYWSYYLFIPTTAILLYLRKDRSLFYSYIFKLSFTMYFCYFSYLFLTARGPQDTLGHLHMVRDTVGFFDAFVRTVQANADIHGAAFPSSHVAAVWIVLIYLFKYKRWVGYLSLPLVLSLTVSVVFLQYHYGIDPIAGALLVFVVYPLAAYVEKKLDFKFKAP